MFNAPYKNVLIIIIIIIIIIIDISNGDDVYAIDSIHLFYRSPHLAVLIT